MLKTSYNFKFISDAGHGWLEVPYAVVKELPIKISAYSYFNPKTNLCYLEEDLDAGLVQDALKEKNIHVKVQHEYQEETFIRNLSRIGY
jgi:hypothetical protein